MGAEINRAILERWKCGGERNFEPCVYPGKNGDTLLIHPFFKEEIERVAVRTVNQEAYQMYGVRLVAASGDMGDHYYYWYSQPLQSHWNRKVMPAGVGRLVQTLSPLENWAQGPESKKGIDFGKLRHRHVVVSEGEKKLVSVMALAYHALPDGIWPGGDFRDFYRSRTSHLFAPFWVVESFDESAVSQCKAADLRQSLSAGKSRVPFWEIWVR